MPHRPDASIIVPGIETEPSAVGAYGRTDVLRAWGLLAAIDIVIRLGGYALLQNLLRSTRVAQSTQLPIDDQTTAAVCGAVNRARQYYVRRARCLQSAATATCLLRFRGIRADCVIGVRKVPFFAHAWVEVGGTVVLNEQQGLRELYTVIDRL